MKTLTVLAGSLAVTLVAGIGPSWPAAPNNTAYVDPKGGIDSATCGAAGSPCATLNQGLANIDTNGTVYVQSGAVFGPVYLTQSVSIVGPDDGSLTIAYKAAAPGCVAASPGTCGKSIANYALEIVSPQWGDFRFKNVTFDAGASTSGAVNVGASGSVSMTNTILRGGSGAIAQIMTVAPNSSNAMLLYLSHCDVGFSSSGGGILVQPQGTALVLFDMHHSQVHNTKFGIKLDASTTTGGVSGSINSSQFFSFNGSGIALVSPSGSFVNVRVSRSTVLNAGVQATQVNTATLALYQDTLTGNAIGANLANGGVGISFGGNEIFGNTTNCAVNGVLSACSQALTHAAPL